MTGTQIPPREPGAALLAAGRFFRPFGQDSGGRRNLPLVSVETFHRLRGRQTSDDAKEA
ncbi:hypothetical protein ACIGXF_26200 [Streptomyces sp. NPDC053086]|uniref:hypothetical protein n=1 Tax=unclassified Streptomyces TaxID=2593676 RepID=UPI0037D2E736